MYTFLISAGITLIALGCIFRNEEKSASNFFTGTLILMAVTLISSLIVTLVHKNKMPLVDTVTICMSYPQVIGYDTTYSKNDTIRNSNSITINVHSYDTVPYGFRVDTILHANTSGILINIDGNDTTLIVYRDAKHYTKFTPCEYKVSDTTKVETHELYRRGDNWVIGWSLPLDNEYTTLHISQKDINTLNTQYPKIFAKWKKV